MIETFIIDWPVLAALGLLFGCLAPAERSWKSRAFACGLTCALTFTATAVISYAVAPDWMWMYFLDPSDVRWVLPFIPLGYLFVFLLSFAAAIELRNLDRRYGWGALVVTLLMELAVIAVTWDRYRLVGTQREWLAGEANELFSASPARDARTISLLGPVFAAVLIVSLVLLWRERRASAARG